MTYSAKSITTKVRGPRSLLATIPYILGFHPRESVVVMSIKGERQRMGLTTRLDRVDFEGARAREAADYLTGLVVRDGGQAATVVGYTDNVAAGRSGGQIVHDAFRAAITAAEVEFFDSLHVAGDQWWSLLGDEHCWANPAIERSGKLPDADDPALGSLAFAAAVEGVAPLPSREALVDSLRPGHPVARAVLSQAVERHASLRSAAGEEALDKDAHLSDARVRTLQLAQAAAATGANGAIDVPTEELAELITGLTDLTARDMCLEWSAPDESQSTIRLWTHLARLAPQPLDAAPLTLLAWCVYRGGNGALARIALDRALHSDPEYGLAQILSHFLDHAVEPSTLRRLERDLRVLLKSPRAVPPEATSGRGRGARRSVPRSRRRKAR